MNALPHAITMFLAIISAHLASRWSKLANKTMYSLIATIISLLFILAGIREMTGNWIF